MYLIIKKVSFLVGLTLCVIINVHSQVVTSTRDGLWTDPTIWSGGQIPTLANASETVINHDVVIPGPGTISIRNSIVNGSLTVDFDAVVDIVADALPERWDLQVTGTLILQDGATLNGTSSSNTSFESGSRYVHLQGPLGFIPYATWDKNSTFEIAGFKTQGYINIAHSDSWKQTFGNVVYNCPEQTTPFVDLNGYLRNIAGTFLVQNTNNQPLRLSTTQSPIISIGEDFVVEGPSKIWLSTNGANTVVAIGKDFRYLSTSSGISYLATKGVVTVNVEGEMEMNTPGKIHMASTSADSVGSRQATFNLSQHLHIISGSFIAPPAPGKGKIVFNGTEIQTVLASPLGNAFQGNLDFVVEENATVDLGSSALANQAGSLLVKGKLQVGSLDPDGSIQLTNKGNLHIQGERIFENGSSIEYNGMAEQIIGDGHPASPGVNLICNNPVSVSLLNEIFVDDLILQGELNTQSFSITIQGDITVTEGVDFTPEQINLSGAKNQNITAPGAAFEALNINKSASSVTLQTPLRISGALIIQSSNTLFHSNGHLVLLSTTDEGTGTANVGSLPSGSSITGDVTVQRYMSGEGRIYRYISSPVQNATVASLMDDFPITGKFQDPSAGPGIQSASPSFYRYDESRGGLQEGWLPYPASGWANANPLIIGKGYAAYIRRRGSSTTWDVTGPLNQGEIELPVAFTANNEESNGWNLVGNPYASVIQWSGEDANKWTMENISSVISIRDNGSGGSTFRYWDMDENYAEIPEGKIAVGQSFWVKATAPNPSLIIREGAKVLSNTTFFRKQPEHIPSFALSLSKDGLVDVAYYKIRPSAKPELDKWDGLKWDNDNFDLSFISSDNKSLAIHAQNNMPCDEIIQIGLKDLKPGAYKLRLTTKHEFSRYKYTLIDKFLNTETRIYPEQPIEFLVTDNSVSYAFDRISIYVDERIPKTDLIVESPGYACSGEVVKLVIKDAEAGVIYSAWDDLAKPLSSINATMDGDLTINFAADSLSPGVHTISFRAQGVCHDASLSSNVTIVKDTPPEIFVSGGLECAGNSVLLEASSDRSDAVFSWFSEIDSKDTIAFTATLETPPLFKSKLYYVAASLPSGCTSARYPVSANVLTYDSAKISLIDVAALSSNYVSNNTWFYNGKKMEEATGQYITLTDPGTYILHVDTLGCISSDSFDYLIMQSETESPPQEFYPNPVYQHFHIKDPDKTIKRIEIYNLLGVLMMNHNTSESKNTLQTQINVSHLPNGTYIAVLTELLRKRAIRFIKE